MVLTRIFGNWFVHKDNRNGVQPEDDGRFLLRLEGESAQGQLCINGRFQVLTGGEARVWPDHDELSLELHTPEGKTEPVETLVLIKGRLFPKPLDADAMLLLLAERLQALEMRVDQEENEINNINKKRRGALYLGGAEQ